ncbi:beta-glucosidase [Paenibacillus sp. FSL H7-0326]|uniref:beta-N-acetylhexosaminidase n=1 Tax=Paenibacillus sp. FSL H7-0326 TaxID=1921144 RepID=UPI00096DD305|nr:beta-N-acetylhexosaminidase [Paenibacillus sp. FSL H7-0326]OMC65666.1 beta-glucosidase [Paenibacillus sp. FSL H7-0326]
MNSNSNVEALLARLSLREKIGQLLLCGLPGPELTEPLAKFIKAHPVGGIIYFARNVESPGQVAQLTHQLQTTAREASQLPLLISIDQEGGMVARIADGITLFPGNMAIAAAGASDDAYEAALASGKELSALGINLNFAPVLDVNNNPLNPVIGVRSFGESAQMVAEYGAQAVRGYQDAGVSACAKHFPGHGDTAADSHLDLPMVPHDLERMKGLELTPFVKAIEEGVDFIMSAHIYFPALEAEKKPATLSSSVLTGLLRDQLGYEGMIMTDCMEMHAIADTYGTVEASVMALEAGADLVLISHTHELLTGAYQAIEQAVLSGRLTEERIDESVRRLLSLKIRRGIMMEDGSFPEEVQAAPVIDANGLPAGVGLAEHGDIARRISERSVTLVRDDAGMLPLSGKKVLAVTVASSAMTIADEKIKDQLSLGAALIEQGIHVEDLSIAAAEVAEQSESVITAAASPDIEQIVIATYNAHFYSEQAELVKQLQATGKPLAVVATRNPYDLMAFPDIKVYIAAYESRPIAMRSVASALLGLIPFMGKLPVTLSDELTAGSSSR